MWSQQSLSANAVSDAGPGTQPSLLGLSMRICEPEFALENVWHVLDVLEGSPAESAGLVPYGDWIVGWSGGVLGAEGDFYDVVEAVSPPFVMTMIPLFTFRSILTSPFVSTSTRMTLSTSYSLLPTFRRLTVSARSGK
jgi:GRASP55/65 PDZ-like domain